MTQELPGTPGDTVMQGLDSLAQRCKEYKAPKPLPFPVKGGREGCLRRASVIYIKHILWVWIGLVYQNLNLFWFGVLRILPWQTTIFHHHLGEYTPEVKQLTPENDGKGRQAFSLLKWSLSGEPRPKKPGPTFHWILVV